MTCLISRLVSVRGPCNYPSQDHTKVEAPCLYLSLAYAPRSLSFSLHRILQCVWAGGMSRLWIFYIFLNILKVGLLLWGYGLMPLCICSIVIVSLPCFIISTVRAVCIRLLKENVRNLVHIFRMNHFQDDM